MNEQIQAQGPPCENTGLNVTTMNGPKLVHESQIAASILHRIDDDDGFALKSLLALFECQTQYEQESGITIEKNGAGFSVPHAKVLTPIAYEASQRGCLTKDQLAVLRKRNKKGVSLLGVYRKQIAQLLEGSIQ